MSDKKKKMSAKEDNDGDSSNTNGNAAATAPAGQQQQQQQQLDEILRLMQSRATGKATNEQLERAVQCMLGSVPEEPATAAAAAATASAQKSSSSHQHVARRNVPVQADTDDYDDSDDDDSDKDGNLRKAQFAKPAPPLLFNDNKKNSTDDNNDDTIEVSIDWVALYGDIPLGQQGARMMQTFGDGSPPMAESVQATLRGARQMTQVAIQDARHVRRQRKKAFQEAQAVLKAETQRLKKRPKPIKTNGGGDGGEDSKTTTTPYQPISQWSPDVLYRVHTGYDSLAYNPPCGFDFEDLEQLFPEEMNVYKHWNKSYQEYADKAQQASEEIRMVVGQSQDEQESNNNNINNDGDDDDDDVNSEGLDPETKEQIMGVGGHLKERAAHFDIRTDHMKRHQYIEFAELRKGSFLPRRMTVVEEQEMGKSLRRGWGSLPPIAIRFLHWVGFDPNSALPPPNLTTTQALAFLAYDFFGRVVEKAIELRQSKNHYKKKSSDGGDRILLELEPGKRLEVNDIEQAMQHPEIRPIPLYRTSDDDTGTTTSGTQLYFGPGFEHRLEMELEEFITASSRGGRKKKKRDEDDEERTKQKEDEELFQRLREA